VDVERSEILALLLRLVLPVVDATSGTSLMIPRSEKEGRGLEEESARPNWSVSSRQHVKDVAYLNAKSLPKSQLVRLD
jgi:hypothetical protein